MPDEGSSDDAKDLRVADVAEAMTSAMQARDPYATQVFATELLRQFDNRASGVHPYEAPAAETPAPQPNTDNGTEQRAYYARTAPAPPRSTTAADYSDGAYRDLARRIVAQQTAKSSARRGPK